MTDGSGDAPQRDEVLARLDALSSEAQALEGDVRAAVDRLRAGLARVRDEVEALGGAEVDGAQHASHAVGADIDGARLTAVTFAKGDERLEVRAKLTIDASDWGDVIQLSGAQWSAGPDAKARLPCRACSRPPPNGRPGSSPR